jgi:hypothetical protein
MTRRQEGSQPPAGRTCRVCWRGADGRAGERTRDLYAKLGVHSRHDAVDRARALALLAPLARRA